MLALVGSGEYLQPMQAVDRYLMRSLGEPARVACLPTAAGTEGDERIAYWSNLGVEYFEGLDAERVEAIHVVNRASADDPGLAARIRDANFIYLSGGKPDYLLQTLIDTPSNGSNPGCISPWRHPGRLFSRSDGDGGKYSRNATLERGFQAVPKCCDHSALRRDARLARACGALARQAQNHLVWDRGLYGFTGERQWLESHRAWQRNGVVSVRKSDAESDLAGRF